MQEGIDPRTINNLALRVDQVVEAFLELKVYNLLISHLSIIESPQKLLLIS